MPLQKVHAHTKKASASVGLRPPDPLPGLCPCTPLGDLFPIPPQFTSP